jgi:hypothetical protein
VALTTNHHPEFPMSKFLRSLALMTALGVTVAGTGLLAQEKKDAKKPADTKKADDKEEKLGKVEIFESKNGFRFRVVGADGKNICGAYKDYKTKEECAKVVEELKAILTKTKPVEVAK